MVKSHITYVKVPQDLVDVGSCVDRALKVDVGALLDVGQVQARTHSQRQLRRVCKSGKLQLLFHPTENFSFQAFQASHR